MLLEVHKNILVRILMYGSEIVDVEGERKVENKGSANE